MLVLIKLAIYFISPALVNYNPAPDYNIPPPLAGHFISFKQPLQYNTPIFTLFLYDSGTTVRMTPELIYRLPEHLLYMPPCAMACMLADLQPYYVSVRSIATTLDARVTPTNVSLATPPLRFSWCASNAKSSRI